MIIREFAAADRPAAFALLQQHAYASVAEIEAMLSQGQRLVACECETLVGFARLKTSRPNSYYLTLLVAPIARQQGIGSSLWQQLQATLPAGTLQIGCFCQAADITSQAFLRKRGWQPWYGLELLHYIGPAFLEPGITARPYSVDDYEEWIRLMNKGFFPMRQAMDIKPYSLYPDEVTNDLATRHGVLAEHDESLLFFDDGQLVGLAVMNGDEIETVTVDKHYRRMGYARQILAYCINRMLERGLNPVTLHVVSWNADARQLYQSMGFRVVNKQAVLRLRLGQ